ncbi:IclR family transcriptional regulator [Levilactobacillus tongjiangensis]|uniref:IclR family transcriptional regulator n=1 Tax=Levilactobacillus tongjiangensis TaxID=2486023 RepID=A0ABW1SSJ7_9LACO|nr:IclR family transcriptional regulator [Levilactobacillus tongjiangensis]
MTKLIQSVQRAAAICRLLTTQPETSLHDLQVALQLPKATTYGLLATLVAERLVYKNPLTAAYSLGPAALVGDQPLTATQLVRLLRPDLQQLARDQNLAVHVAVRQAERAHYLAKIEAPHPQHVSAQPGQDDSLAITATGKLLLSASPADFQASYLASLAAPLARQLRAELPSIRHRNVAYDRGEQTHQIDCVATGLRDHRGQVIASVSLVLPATANTTDLQTGEQQLLALTAALAPRI